MKAYDGHLSGRCRLVRIILALLAIDYEPVRADLDTGAHKIPDFRVLNRFAGLEA
jgi:glutathione S-transferase